jgi:hypothetical protein
MIVLRYYKLFKIDASENMDTKNLLNITIHLITECARGYDYRIGNLIFAPCACALILLFSFLINGKKRCLKVCNSRPGKILN